MLGCLFFFSYFSVNIIIMEHYFEMVSLDLFFVDWVLFIFIFSKILVFIPIPLSDFQPINLNIEVNFKVLL